MYRNKKGFTLLEMMLVVGIIVVLSAVGMLSIGETLRRQKLRQEEYKVHADTIDTAQKQVHNLIGNKPDPVTPAGVKPGVPESEGGDDSPTDTPTETPTETPTTTPPVGGGGTLVSPSPTVTPTNTPTPTEIPPEEKEDEKKDEKTDEVVGDVVVKGGYVKEGYGTREVKSLGDGSYSIKVSNDNSNNITFTVDKYGVITIPNNNNWILGNAGININKPHVLTNDEKSKLEEKFGLQFGDFEEKTLDKPQTITPNGVSKQTYYGGAQVRFSKPDFPIGAKTVTITIKLSEAKDLNVSDSHATVNGDTVTYVYDIDDFPDQFAAQINCTGTNEKTHEPGISSYTVVVS